MGQEEVDWDGEFGGRLSARYAWLDRENIESVYLLFLVFVPLLLLPFGSADASRPPHILISALSFSHLFSYDPFIIALFRAGNEYANLLQIPSPRLTDGKLQITKHKPSYQPGSLSFAPTPILETRIHSTHMAYTTLLFNDSPLKKRICSRTTCILNRLSTQIIAQ